MSRIASRLTELGLTLPPPMQAPGGIKLPFPWINVRATASSSPVTGRRTRTARSPARSAKSAPR